MSTLPTKAYEEIVNLASKSAVSLVRFIFCDTSSIIRGKATKVERLRDRLESGIGLVKGTMAMNMLDQTQFGTGLSATGEIRLVPDPDTWTVLPYCDRSAAMICDLVELDHKPWVMCPRTLLKRQIASAKEMGLSFQVSFEPEFMLGNWVDGRFVFIDDSRCFSTDGMNRASKFINRFADCLERQNIEVEQYYPEYGPGQHELSIRHAEALRACDRHIYYRETLRGVAAEQNIEAFLAPKPFADKIGNGCHLHVSVWDAYGERNLLWSDSGLSDFGRYFVAGMLAHLKGIVALTCASVNSYRRLKPNSWSSAYTCWGFENREAAIRIPSVYWGQEMATTNIELKCVDSSSNPYLALAAVIAAGIDGVKRQLELPSQVSVNPSTLSEEEMEHSKVERLPQSLQEALNELQKDQLLMNMLGEFGPVYIGVKSSECGAFAAADDEFELSHHRSIF